MIEHNAINLLFPAILAHTFSYNFFQCYFTLTVNLKCQWRQICCRTKTRITNNEPLLHHWNADLLELCTHMVFDDSKWIHLPSWILSRNGVLHHSECCQENQVGYPQMCEFFHPLCCIFYIFSCKFKLQLQITIIMIIIQFLKATIYRECRVLFIACEFLFFNIQPILCP